MINIYHMLVYKYIPAYGIYLVFSYWLLLLEVVRETNTVKTKTSFFEDWEVWGSLQDNYLIVAPQAREIFEKS